jgi:hypothetical protein
LVGKRESGSRSSSGCKGDVRDTGTAGAVCHWSAAATITKAARERKRVRISMCRLTDKEGSDQRTQKKYLLHYSNLMEIELKLAIRTCNLNANFYVACG